MERQVIFIKRPNRSPIRKYPWKDMRVGDWFVNPKLPHTCASVNASNLRMLGKNMGMVIETEVQTDLSVLVRRVK